MKVEKFQTFQQQKRPLNRANVTPSFGSATAALKLTDQITDNLKHKNIISWMKSLKWLKGEAGGIIITALGTGIVAPFFIGANPLVRPKPGESQEELEKKKWYTALRQPLSAVLAIIFQLSAQKPIDIFLDKVFNDPQYSKNAPLHLDQSKLNTDSRIEDLVKKQMAENGQVKPPIWKYFTKEYKDYNKAYKENVKALEKQQIEQLAEEFRTTGKFVLNDTANRTLDNPTLAKLLNEQIDSYIADGEKLQIKGNRLAFYVDRAQTLIENKDEIRRIFSEAKTKNSVDEVTEYFKQLLAEEVDDKPKMSNPKLREILQEVIDRPEEIRLSRLDRTLERITQIEEYFKTDNFTSDGYCNVLSDRNKELDNIVTKLRRAKITNPESISASKINDVIKNIVAICSFKKDDRVLSPILHDTITFDNSTENLTKKIHRDIVKAYKKFVGNEYKSFNQVSKVVVGVGLTLPVTCTALNYIYPRFMKKFFPSLCPEDDKKVNNEGGNK